MLGRCKVPSYVRRRPMGKRMVKQIQTRSGFGWGGAQWSDVQDLVEGEGHVLFVCGVLGKVGADGHGYIHKKEDD